MKDLRRAYKQLKRRAHRKVASQAATGPENGFTLIEVVISMIIIMVALLGVFTVFTYAILYNAGNKGRSEALQVLRQKVEQLRAAQFTLAGTDAELIGGAHAQEVVTVPDGGTFTIDYTVDDDPTVGGTQVEGTDSCASPQGTVIPCTIKEITIVATVAAPTPGWQTAVPARIVLRRVRGN
jgi:Tfp pilus assembly protein PilV